jgi:hypothetical protein
LNAQEFNYQALTARLMRLVKLDTSVFDEVRLDASATIPSIAVAVVATFLAGLGGWLWWTFQDFGDKGKILMQSFLLGSVFSIALWVVWLLIVYVLLTQVFKAQADIQQLARTMGMAAAPLALSVLMFIPALDFAIGLTSLALFFGLTTFAIQASTSASAGQVLVCNAAGFAIWAIVLALLVGSNNAFAPGFFLIDATKEAMTSLADLPKFLG